MSSKLLSNGIIDRACGLEIRQLANEEDFPPRRGAWPIAKRPVKRASSGSHGWRQIIWYIDAIHNTSSTANSEPKRIFLAIQFLACLDLWILCWKLFKGLLATGTASQHCVANAKRIYMCLSESFNFQIYVMIFHKVEEIKRNVIRRMLINFQ
jgi:hypothetical protein